MNINGTNGNDTLDGTSDGDRISGLDGDDTLRGLAGDDTLLGNQGADQLFGGSGDDILNCGAGVDTLYGGIGFDTYIGADNSDIFVIRDDEAIDDLYFGGAGGADEIVIASDSGTVTLRNFSSANVSRVERLDANNIDIQGTSEDNFLDFSFLSASNMSMIFGLDGDDIIIGSGSSETIDGGTGNDSLDGGVGSDLIFGGDGNDTLEGGIGFDTLDGGTGDDTYFGGDSSDVFLVRDDEALNDTFFGGGSNGDVIEVASDSGPVTFEELSSLNVTDVERFDGGDQVVLGTNEDNLLDFSIFSNSSNVSTIDGLAGDDTIIATDDDDVIFGGEGADTLDGGAQDDTISGGEGDDVLEGGSGNDVFVFQPGDGADIITDFNNASGEIADGIMTNNDFIDLSGYYDGISELHADFADDGLLNQSNLFALNGQSVDYSDNIQFLSGDSISFVGATADSSSFTFENTGVTCFTGGTRILTPKGEVEISQLKVGDLVVTADNGPKEILWIGQRRVSRLDLADERFVPVRLPKGWMGLHKDIFVSQQHGLMVDDNQLVRAKHLVGSVAGARFARGRTDFIYYHLLFEDHQLIFANGTGTESLYLGDQAIHSLGPAVQEELSLMFPDLLKKARGRNGEKILARPFLSARLVPSVMQKVA